MSNIIFGGNGPNAERCSDVDLEPNEAIREAFAVMLQADEGIDFGEVLRYCGISRRATKTLTDCHGSNRLSVQVRAIYR